MASMFKKLKGKLKGSKASDKPDEQGASSAPAAAVSASTASPVQLMWDRIPGRVSVGGTKYWDLDTVLWKDIPNTQDTEIAFSTAEFYGCTVVLIADAKHALIGHYHEYRDDPGSSGSGTKVMDNKAKVQKYIIEELSKELLLWDFDDACRAWIIHSSARGSVGYTLIKDHLVENGMPLKNIDNCTYSATSGSLGTFQGPKGKAILHWKRNATGAILSVYIQKEEPIGEFPYAR